MVTDGELLAACRSAGEPGTESHRAACRLYRRSVLEWQAGHAGWRRERANRATAGLLVALLAEAAESAGLLDNCGTHGGYNWHVRGRTLVCPRCERAEREYRQGLRRGRAAELRGQSWAEAA